MSISVYRTLKNIHKDGIINTWHDMTEDNSTDNVNHFFDQLIRDGYIIRQKGRIILTNEGRDYINVR